MRTCKLNPYKNILQQWLIADQTAPKKQRYTARRVFHRLKEMEEQKGKTLYTKERTIRDLVRNLKQELEQKL